MRWAPVWGQFPRGHGLRSAIGLQEHHWKARDNNTCCAKSSSLAILSYLAGARTGGSSRAAGGEDTDAVSLSMTMTPSEDELLGRRRLSRLVEGGAIAERSTGQGVDLPVGWGVDAVRVQEGKKDAGEKSCHAKAGQPHLISGPPRECRTVPSDERMIIVNAVLVFGSRLGTAVS